MTLGEQPYDRRENPYHDYLDLADLHGQPKYAEVVRNLFMGDVRSVEDEFFARLRKASRFMYVDMDGRAYFRARDGEKYLNWPIEDGEMPANEEGIRLASQMVAEWMKTNPVLVTCGAGLNRSGLITARALMYGGSTPDEAITRVRLARGVYSMSNPHFCAWLQREGPSLASDYARQEMEGQERFP